MWLMGVLAMMSLIWGLIVFANRKPRPPDLTTLWDIGSLVGVAIGVESFVIAFHGHQSP